MEATSILVVDDTSTSAELVQRHLTRYGCRVVVASGVGPAMRLLEQTPVDIVVTDLRLGDGTGLDLVRHVRQRLPDTEVMLVTGYATIEGAVDAVRQGASEYVVKPFTHDELIEAVQRTLHRLRLRRAATAGTPPDDLAPPAIVARSEAMRRVFTQVARAGFSSATVLITGESGTGKELVARAVHDGSARVRGPFVPVNCGAIPETLLESELFGHVKGAFTGAERNRIGYFQTAHGGTIFLDELSETTPAAQLKLLRVLQDREVYPVGSSQPLRVDVRVVAATNKDLVALMEQGSFREDLFYRINILPIQVPALRERGDDVLLLAAHFAAQYAAEIGRRPIRFSDDVLSAFLSYSWPGNVRELQNVIQQLVVMKVDDSVVLSDLPVSMKSDVRPRRNGRSLTDIEAEHIRAVLVEVGGNKAEAARILGIDRKTLYGKIRRYKLG
jgi:two-component system, NtrC family, response regulator HydG